MVDIDAEVQRKTMAEVNKPELAPQNMQSDEFSTNEESFVGDVGMSKQGTTEGGDPSSKTPGWMERTMARTMAGRGSTV
jgi:hypothetical protein